ncbi:MAG: hypothetical protein HXS43_01970 [Theionarchaea archaeon]|nr:hypothetical protein [Theionarchaea archaeon]
MSDEENTLYYGIILACIVGIILTSAVLIKNNPTEEEFTELYFYFERIDLTDGEGTFQGIQIQVGDSIWIDLDGNQSVSEEETFLAGDTFAVRGEFWNISDVAKDGGQILLGKFPKNVRAGEINFSFVVVNHLLQDHQYTYVITANGQSSEGTVLIKKDEKRIIPFSCALTEAGEWKVRITVDTGEEIYFYLTVE